MEGESLRTCKVVDVAAVERNALVGGPFGSDLVSRDYVPFGIPVIRGANMGRGRWVAGEFVYVTPQKAESLAANCAKPGDLVFTQRGTLGQVAIVPKGQYERYLISQSQMKLTVAAGKADPLFIYYVFTSAEQQEYIRNNAIQTGVPHTNLGILRGTPLKLPTLPEQKRIAHILGTLDDKIELNRRMNATLEAMSRAIFKSWFVDFDPVRAKAAGRQPEGMDAEMAALFPVSFEESEIGEVPKGWQVATVSDVADLYSGGTPSKSESGYWDGRIPWVSPKAMTRLHVDDSSERVTDSAIGNGTRLVPPESVLVMVRGMGLHQGVRVSQAKCAVTFNQDVKALVATRVPATYLMSRLVHETSSLHAKVQSSGHGTGVLPTEFLEQVPVIVPSREEGLRRLITPLAAFDSESYSLVCQERTLAALRDTLLPKLLSGEVRVPEVEMAVEEATG
jgi:type I restriction enzyme S subunit